MSEPIAIPTLTAIQFKELLAGQDLPIVAEFWASWCAPCRHMAQDLQALVGEFEGRLTLVRVDIDASLGLAETHGVGSVPTLLAFSKGQEIDRESGPLRPSTLHAFLARAAVSADLH